MPDIHNDEPASTRHRSTDCDRRLTTLETASEYLTDEVTALRNTLREHDGWLNRHNGDIAGIKQSLAESIVRRVATVEGEIVTARLNLEQRAAQIVELASQAKAAAVTRDIVDEHTKQIGAIASDMKVLAWKVGAIIGALLFLANLAVSKIHF